MALRIRRGTDAERQEVIFAEGELIYTTDTRLLYVGDGTTIGGIPVSNSESGGLFQLLDDTSPQLGGDLDLNQQTITGTGEVDISGSITADIISGTLFVGDGSGLFNLPESIIEGETYRINISGFDSSLILDADASILSVNTASFSSINTINNFLEMSSSDFLNTESQEFRISSNNNRSFITLSRKSEGVIDNLPLGSILFEKDDDNGTISNGIIIGRTNSIIISSDDTGVFDLDTFVTVYNGGLLGVGTAVPEAKLDVHGDSVLRGSLTVDGLVSVGKFTSTEQDSFGNDSTDNSGKLFYNSTTNRFQFFQAGSWVNLINNGTSVGQLLSWNGTEWSAVDPVVTEGTIENANLLNGFSGSHYLDYNNFINTPTIPTSLTDLGISDGTSGQVLTTNGSGSFSFADVNGLKSRGSLAGSTGSIANGASASVNITGYKGYMLYKVATSAAAWVRLYISEAARTADASRTQGQDPLPSSGVIAEVITTGAETVIIAPGAIGFNNESPVTNIIPVAVTNLSGGAANITVTLTAVEMEA
jgi:hypothetical protein